MKRVLIFNKHSTIDEILYTRIILADKNDKDGTSRIVCIGIEDADKLKEICKDLKEVCVVYNTEEDITGAWDE